MVSLTQFKLRKKEQKIRKKRKNKAIVQRFRFYIVERFLNY
jgi:hypothetical protein